MTPCPQCGRLGLEDVECVACGYLPRADEPLIGGLGATAADATADEDGAEETPSLTRVGALVVIACLLAIGAAIVLIRLPGVTRHGAGQPAGLPATSSTVVSTPSSALPTTSAPASRTPTPPPTRTPAPTKAPSSSAVTSARAVSRTSAPVPPPSPRPSTSFGGARSVGVAEGGQVTDGSCNPRRCHYLVVTLTGFAAGQHGVSCFSAKAGEFGSYTTSATTSAVCTDARPGDTVWAVVDGVRSPSIAW